MTAPKPPLIHLFYRLWDKAVGKDGYNKGEWQTLERFILPPAAPVAVPAEPRQVAIVGVGRDAIGHVVKAIQDLTERAVEENKKITAPAPLPPPQEPCVCPCHQTKDLAMHEGCLTCDGTGLKKAAALAGETLTEADEKCDNPWHLSYAPCVCKERDEILLKQGWYIQEYPVGIATRCILWHESKGYRERQSDSAKGREEITHQVAFLLREAASRIAQLEQREKSYLEELKKHLSQAPEESVMGGIRNLAQIAQGFVEANEQLATAEAALTQARAQKSALMEAIEPLALASKFMVDTITDDESLGGWGITAGHSRKALRVYEQVKKDTALPSQSTTPQP